jgi:shikimate kinase
VTARAARGRHLVLIGLPGAGKSVVGRRVARLLQRRFLDLDRLIERDAGCTVAELFAREGEPAFRARERAVTESLVAAPASVVAPGGGWVLDPANPAAIAARSTIVWLRVTPAVALARMGQGVTRRPLLAGPDPLAALTALAEQRAPRYAAAADVTLDSEGLPLPELARRLAALVDRRTGASRPPRTPDASPR